MVQISKPDSQGVAQPGSAPGLEPGGRRFESYRPDQTKEALMRRDDDHELPSFRNLAQAEAGVMRPKRKCGAATASCTATRS